MNGRTRSDSSQKAKKLNATYMVKNLEFPFLHYFKSSPALSLWVEIVFYMREIKQIVQTFHKKDLQQKHNNIFATLIAG